MSENSLGAEEYKHSGDIGHNRHDAHSVCTGACHKQRCSGEEKEGPDLRMSAEKFTKKNNILR